LTEITITTHRRMDMLCSPRRRRHKHTNNYRYMLMLDMST
jgi:hypothetical protein